MADPPDGDVLGLIIEIDDGSRNAWSDFLCLLACISTLRPNAGPGAVKHA